MGSSSSTDSGRSLIGRLGRPHGLDGYLGLYIEPEDADGIGPGSIVFVQDRALVVRVLRRVDRGYQIAFEDVTSRADAESLRGGAVFVEGRRQLGEGEYWPKDLIGITVFDENGTRVGTVTDVLFGAGQDRLQVTPQDGPPFEVPFVAALVPVVDLDSGRIEIVAVPGLSQPSG